MKKNKATRTKQWYNGKEPIIPQLGDVVLDKRGNRYIIKGIGVNRLYVYRETDTPDDVVTAKLFDMFPLESDVTVMDNWEEQLRKKLESTQ